MVRCAGWVPRPGVQRQAPLLPGSSLTSDQQGWVLPAKPGTLESMWRPNKLGAVCSRGPTSRNAQGLLLGLLLNPTCSFGPE